MTTTTNSLSQYAKNLQTSLGLRYRPVVVRAEVNAWSIASHTSKSRVILGDDGLFLVVCPADANKLEAAGYAYAR